MDCSIGRRCRGKGGKSHQGRNTNCEHTSEFADHKLVLSRSIFHGCCTSNIGQMKGQAHNMKLRLPPRRVVSADADQLYASVRGKMINKCVVILLLSAGLSSSVTLAQSPLDD